LSENGLPVRQKTGFKEPDCTHFNAFVAFLGVELLNHFQTKVHAAYGVCEGANGNVVHTGLRDFTDV